MRKSNDPAWTVDAGGAVKRPRISKGDVVIIVFALAWTVAVIHDLWLGL